MVGFKWMIYGATGFTGKLVAAEAVKRGHRPLLAGRNPEKLARLAADLDLDYVDFTLDDVNVVAEHIADMDIVYHAAGPFIYTAEPMIKACLATKTHYLDITGEIHMLERTFSYDETARKIGIALISGAGFDVVPTNCLAKYVADQVPGAHKLEIVIAAISHISAGTAKSGIEMAHMPGKIRRDGILVDYPIGVGGRKMKMPLGDIFVLPIPWGDLDTAYRATGIPNITTYFQMPEAMISLARMGAPIMQWIFQSGIMRKGASALMNVLAYGPSDQLRETGRSFIWARAEDEEGQVAEAWIETLEAYQFTAETAVLAVESIAENQPVGALPPALAFGTDFVLEVNDTQRHDVSPPTVQT